MTSGKDIKKEQGPELIEIPAGWDLSWLYSAGEVGSRYITELRDHCRIMATKCPKCDRILLPPRSFCERCFVSLKEHWVELEPSGTLEAFTIVTEPFEGLRAPPYVIGYFKIGGATTNIPHFLEEIDLSDVEKARQELRVGMPVEVVFKEQRTGTAADFFIRPAKGAARAPVREKAAAKPRKVENVQVPGRWEVPYAHDIGKTASRFLIELRDNSRIMATKCPQCRRIMLPPRSTCERCFTSIEDNWVEAGPEGILEAFTIVTSDYSFPGMPAPPFVACLVKMGGSSTAMPQMLLGVDLSDPRKLARKLKAGLRVKAVFHQERKGRITDFHVELAE